MQARMVGHYVLALAFAVAVSASSVLADSEQRLAAESLDEARWIDLRRAELLLGGAIIPELGNGFWMRLRSESLMLHRVFSLDTNDTAVLISGDWLYLGEHQVRLDLTSVDFSFLRLAPALELPTQRDDISVRGGLAFETRFDESLGLHAVQAFTANDRVLSFSGRFDYTIPRLFHLSGAALSARYRMDVPFAGDDRRSSGFVEAGVCSPGILFDRPGLTARLCAIGRWDSNTVERLIADVPGFFSVDPSVASYFGNKHVSSYSALIGVSVLW